MALCNGLRLKGEEWFDQLCRDIRSLNPSAEVIDQLLVNRDRIIYTINFLQKFSLPGRCLCEIGFGGVGLACAKVLNMQVEAYDCSELFKPLCEAFQIPWRHIDLNKAGIVLDHSYDIILLCEVIEHLARWPAEVMAELKNYLKPGGLLLITTPNLHRLSNIIRMCTGRRLFAHFVPEELVMGHLREYTPEELIYLINYAGFSKVEVKQLSFPDLEKSRLLQIGYDMVCKIIPKFSNYIFCWAINN